MTRERVAIVTDRARRWREQELGTWVDFEWVGSHSDRYVGRSVVEVSESVFVFVWVELRSRFADNAVGTGWYLSREHGIFIYKSCCRVGYIG